MEMHKNGQGRGKIKVGLVGIGRAGWGMHRPEIAKAERLFTIVAACDPKADRRERIADAIGCRAYRSITELIADPEVELVDIASRTPEHVSHAIEALKAGKIVFLEKPIALSFEEAKTLEEAAKRYKGQIYFRHNRRFEPAFQHVREIIDSGILGNVHTMKFCRNSFQRRDDWQTIMECGGGQLLNWGPHIIDHALRLLDAPVVDMWSHLNRIAAVGDAEDHLRIMLKGANDRVAEVQISGGAAIGEPTYTVHGSRGSLVSVNGGFRLRYVSPTQKFSRIRAKKQSPSIDASFGNSEKLKWIEKEIPVKPKLKVDMGSTIWKCLYKTIRKGEPFPITFDQALSVMEVISKARKGTRFDVTA